MEEIVISLIKIAVIIGLVLTIVGGMSLMERKILGWIQMRPGPNRVGPWGILQPLADGVKFMWKEDIVPSSVSQALYLLAPILSFVPALMTFAVVPFGSTYRGVPLRVTALDIGLLYVLALTSLTVYGVVLAGWSSNSKYSLLGGLRSSSQMISYELALSLSIVGVLLQANTLDLTKIVESQAQFFMLGGFPVLPKWNVFWFQELGFLVFWIASVAETNRTPFDLPEADSELVAGFFTEYSSIKFLMFFLGEYSALVAASSIMVVLYFGGWHGPYAHEYPLLGVVYFAVKLGIFLFLFIWIRGTLPRFRYDQLMNFGWKFLLPMAILNIILSATIRVFTM